MYRLYHNIPKSLEHVSAIFKQALNSSLQEQVRIRKIIELHDKYMAYVVYCFQNNSLFHQAFEIFCNKTMAVGATSAELMTTFCDNILKKEGSEKLGDEAIEETLDKVVKLLAYIKL